eukprot:scaffold3.g6693.t1
MMTMTTIPPTRASTRAALAAADEGEAGGPATDAVVAAAWAGRVALLDSLLAAGARITVHTLAAAFQLHIAPGAFRDEVKFEGVDARRADALRGVRLLLAQSGALESSAGGRPSHHPVLRLIADLKAERGEFGILITECHDNGPLQRGWFDSKVAMWEATALTYLKVAEALAEAGYAFPSVLRSVGDSGGSLHAIYHPMQVSWHLVCCAF